MELNHRELYQKAMQTIFRLIDQIHGLGVEVDRLTAEIQELKQNSEQSSTSDEDL